MDSVKQDWRSLSKWKNAVVVAWTTPAPPGVTSARDVAEYLGSIAREYEVRADYREVWQKDMEKFVVVAWFCDAKVSGVSAHVENIEELLAEKGFDCEVLKYFPKGEGFTEEEDCFKDCVKILETVDGDYVDISEVYSPLSVIQYYNGYQLKGECENPNRHLD
tara:strand:- start:1541 stop:2029 length:489 start_codon:yes stop_codon:yes gene_type:complete